MLSKFSNIPLISDKSLTISDVLGFTKGELAIYIQDNGNTSLGIRAALKDLPKETFDAHGIVIHEIDENRLILANTLLSFSNIEIERKWNWPNVTSILGKNYLGQVILFDDEVVRGNIYEVKNGLEISLPKTDLTSLPWKDIPKETFAILSTPNLTKGNKMLSLFIGSLISEFDINLANFTKMISENLEIASLVHDQAGVGFILISKINESSNEMNTQIIKLSAALRSPQILDLVLPDESVAKEIVIDPSSVSVEETVVSGSIWSRVRIDSNNYLLTGYDSGKLVISNRESLLRFWQTGEEEGTKQILCMGESGYIDMKTWIDLSANNISTRYWHKIFPIMEIYSLVGVRNTWFRTKISLCN